MELHEVLDVRRHGLGTASMVEWRACEDTRIRIGQGVKVGGAREASCVHGNVYGQGKVRLGQPDWGWVGRENTDECSSRWCRACASSTLRASGVCRLCTARECRRGSGPRRRQRKIELGRLTRRGTRVAEVRTWVASGGVVG